MLLSFYLKVFYETDGKLADTHGNIISNFIQFCLDEVALDL